MSAEEEYTIKSALPRFHEILEQLDTYWIAHQHKIQASKSAAKTQRSFATPRTVTTGLVYLQRRVQTLNARIRSLEHKHKYHGLPQISANDVLDTHLSGSTSTQTAACQLRYIISESTDVLNAYEESVAKEEKRIAGLLSWSRELLTRLQCFESERVFLKLLSLVGEKWEIKDRIFDITIPGSLASPRELEGKAERLSNLENTMEPHCPMLRVYDFQIVALLRAIQEMDIKIPRQRMITEFFTLQD